MKRLLLFVLALAPGFTQTPISLFPRQVKEYLALTDAQVSSIIKLSSDYSSFTLQKQLRISQVQRELATEMAKDQLDPMALGLRYVELETIRRENNEQLQKTRTSIVALLTDAQKVKLKALEDALKLQPVITEAQCENLLAQSAATAVPGIRTGDFSGSLISGGVISFSPSLCTSYGQLILTTTQP